VRTTKARLSAKTFNLIPFGACSHQSRAGSGSKKSGITWTEKGTWGKQKKRRLAKKMGKGVPGAPHGVTPARKQEKRRKKNCAGPTGRKGQ